MTPDEAREHIGQKVVYRWAPDATPEEGVITSVGERWVFVRYGSDTWAKATPAEHLERLS